MRENDMSQVHTLGNELSIDLGRLICFRQDHHPFPDIFASDPLEGKRGRLTGGTDCHWYSFPLYRTDVRRRKLAKRIRANQDIVTCMYCSCTLSCQNQTMAIFVSSPPTTLHHTGHDCPDEGDGECIVDMKLERRLGIIISMVREDIEEDPDQIQAFASDV